MGFTPFSHEHVGNLAADSAPDLYLFSILRTQSTKDPIGRFERSLVDVDESVKKRFIARTFCVFGLRLEWPKCHDKTFWTMLALSSALIAAVVLTFCYVNA